MKTIKETPCSLCGQDMNLPADASEQFRKLKSKNKRLREQIDKIRYYFQDIAIKGKYGPTTYPDNFDEIWKKFKETLNRVEND